ncbi:hypothetical protein GUG62_22550 [Xanthomonas citri pv. citri]|nr:hypothetical protein [Xanthomonas citri pv. citri]
MGKTPAQKKRNKYLASVRARGASGHNFWFVSPPQDTQALPLTLSSDIELGDFFYLEGSPDVAFVDYFPCGPGERTRTLGGSTSLPSPRWRRVPNSTSTWPLADKASAAGRRLISLAVLNAAKVRIQSWRAIVPTTNPVPIAFLGPSIATF